MLVLSRKPGERILVGKDVKITVIRVGPNSVRIGIDAPSDMNIVREELCLGADREGPHREGQGQNRTEVGIRPLDVPATQ